MSDIKISLVASANRPLVGEYFRNWERFVNSLKENKISYEVIFVGNVECPYPIDGGNFKWIHATVKPAQCYEIGFRAAKGELIGWTADDADYNHPTRNCPDALDRVYKHYKEFEEKYGDYKTIIAMRPIEDGGDVYDFHHFFGGWHHTPVMAPFGFINRKWFVEELGGYDKRFFSGQSENDVVMRAYEDGGRVEICMDCFVYVHHRQVHPKAKPDNKFRAFYRMDREFLENCWVIGGFGNYEAKKMDAKISPTRLIKLQRYEETPDWCFKTQGPAGMWGQ